jgi:hypothetical protein
VQVISGNPNGLERGGNMKNKIVQKCMLLIVTFLLSACGNKEISFRSDIQPILKQYCMECHAESGKGYEKSGLLMTSYESLMKGTKFGAIIKPGDSLSSALMMLVEGRADPSIKMPHGKEPLPKDRIDLLKKWVEQGAKNN